MAVPITRDRRGSGLIPGLELLRGLACLMVFASHLLSCFPSHEVLLYALFNWGTEAVVVFFVLSGLVIALSEKRTHRGPVAFMRARIRRLLPIYLVVVLASALIDRWLSPPLQISTVIGHLFFLQDHIQGYIVPVFGSNPPLWSLSFEFYFYLTYALTIGSYQKFRLAIWWGLGLLVMLITPYHQLQGPLGLFQMILASSPIWLLGTSLVRPWPIFRFSFLQALILFSSIPLFARAGVAVYFHNFMVSLLIFPLFWVLTAPSRRQTTLPVPGWIWIVVGVCYGCGAALFLWTTPIGRGPMLVYISLPILIAVLGAFWKLFGPARFEILGLASFSLVLGRMSYAIYLIHNPIITVMQSFMHDVRLELVVDVTTAFALAALLEYIWQPWAAHLFDRVWTMEPKKHMAVENAPEG